MRTGRQPTANFTVFAGLVALIAIACAGPGKLAPPRPQGASGSIDHLEIDSPPTVPSEGAPTPTVRATDAAYDEASQETSKAMDTPPPTRTAQGGYASIDDLGKVYAWARRHGDASVMLGLLPSDEIIEASWPGCGYDRFEVKSERKYVKYKVDSSIAGLEYVGYVASTTPMIHPKSETQGPCDLRREVSRQSIVFRLRSDDAADLEWFVDVMNIDGVGWFLSKI